MENEKCCSISQNDVETIARMVLPDIRDFYTSNEGRKLYEEWEEEHNSNKHRQSSSFAIEKSNLKGDVLGELLG